RPGDPLQRRQRGDLRLVHPVDPDGSLGLRLEPVPLAHDEILGPLLELHGAPLPEGRNLVKREPDATLPAFGGRFVRLRSLLSRKRSGRRPSPRVRRSPPAIHAGAGPRPTPRAGIPPAIAAPAGPAGARPPPH